MVHHAMRGVSGVEDCWINLAARARARYAGLPSFWTRTRRGPRNLSPDNVVALPARLPSQDPRPLSSGRGQAARRLLFFSTAVTRGRGSFSPRLLGWSVSGRERRWSYEPW